MEISKKKVGAVLGGVAVFAIVSASAATLGGINADSVGGEQASVRDPLDNGVTVTWDTDYDTDSAAYIATDVTLSTVDGEAFPEGSEVKLVVASEDGTELKELTETEVAGTNVTELTFDVTDLDLQEIQRVAVVVDGNEVATTVAD